MKQRSRITLKGRREGGTFSAWPHACHEHENYTRLSLPARALLMEFLGQLRRENNGDLSCAFTLLAPRGWRSRTTIEHARKELEDAGWILRTRQGGRNMPNLYAVTWLSIEHCKGKLDMPPGPPPGTWKKQFDMPSKWPTVAQQMGKPCTADGQHPPKVAQQMGKSA